MSTNLAYQEDAGEEKPQEFGLAGAHIVWRAVNGKGRGVFTTRDIKKGELIEVAPAVPMDEEDVPDDDPPDGYVLEWDEDTEGEEYAMVLGYAMLYNHSETPNIELETDIDEQVVNVRALRDIKAGEELCWYYSADIWFDPQE